MCTSICQCHMSMSVYPSVFSFPDDGFSPDFVCALILCRSGLGFLIGKFRQFLTDMSTTCPYFSFQTITCKCQWIFIKLGMYFDITICFMIANEQISSIFDSYPLITCSYSFRHAFQM